MGYEKTTDNVIIVLDAILQILKAIRKLTSLSSKKGKKDSVYNND